MQEKDIRVIQSVQRAIDIIKCFNNSSAELSLGEISSILGLNKSTVHGLISTLCLNDYLDQSSNGKYKLGQVFTNGQVFEENTKKILLKEKSRSTMQSLSNKYVASSAIFVREKNDLIILQRITPNNANYIITVHDTIISPLHTSASGKILLAAFSQQQLENYLISHPLLSATSKTITNRELLQENLVQIRTRMYSVEDEELGQGIYAISVPILDDKNTLFATLSLTGMSSIIKGNKNVIADLKSLSRELSSQVFY